MSATIQNKKNVFFVKENFLEDNFCRKVCLELKSSLPLQSPLPEYKTGIPVQTDTSTRPKIVKEISTEAAHKIREKLSELMPEIAEYFGLKLKELRDVHFAIYDKGNYVARHVDAVESQQDDQNIYYRKITVVIFLNDETEEPTKNCYGGGKLTIYGVFENETFKDFGFPMTGMTGKLVAFQSTSLHEVTPVKHGTRLIISTGFS